MRVAFIGNGGHAGNLRDICDLNGIEITTDGADMVLAFGGVTCEALENRCMVYPHGQYVSLIHPSAIWSKTCQWGEGVQIMAGAIIQHNAHIMPFCIINTRAVVEHDTVIGKGCHIAPGAVVLGNCDIGEYCFIGANAVVVQGSKMPPRTFVKAGSVWKS